MEGTLIAFRLATYDKDRASELVKRLYGQRTSSHGGRYVYRRKALFDEIPPVRMIRGLIPVRREDAESAVQVLHPPGANVHSRKTPHRGALGLRALDGIGFSTLSRGRRQFAGYHVHAAEFLSSRPSCFRAIA